MRVKKGFCWAVLPLLGVLMGAAAASPDLLGLMAQSQARLNAAYALELDGLKTKKSDIQLTREGFFRCRRTLASGKQEFFSFSIADFEQLDYLGTSQSGWMVLKTRPESIIVQTFRDPRGNIDTMASELKLPFKNLEAADLQKLNSCFERIRERLKN